MSAAYTPQNKNAQKLLDMLAARAMNKKNHSVDQLAEQLRITVGFFNQLQNGIRQMHSVSDELLAEMAKYLGVPFDDVRVLAGKHPPASNSPQQTAHVVQGRVPHVVVTIEADGTLDTRADSAVNVFVIDRRLRDNDHALQIGGVSASLRSLLEGLSGSHPERVREVADDVLNALELLRAQPVTCELGQREQTQIQNFRNYLRRDKGVPD